MRDGCQELAAIRASTKAHLGLTPSASVHSSSACTSGSRIEPEGCTVTFALACTRHVHTICVWMTEQAQHGQASVLPSRCLLPSALRPSGSAGAMLPTDLLTLNSLHWRMARADDSILRCC